MRRFFFALVSFASASSLVDDKYEKYEEKLRSYQNLTNLDEDRFNTIFENGLSNRE